LLQSTLSVRRIKLFIIIFFIKMDILMEEQEQITQQIKTTQE